MSNAEPQQPVRWAIEDSFPIVEINRLAVPERNSFKPIYQMHKWFARRASCVFRAILLGALKPLPLDKDGNPTKSGAQAIMEEFYKNHTRDPDTNGKVILDPFMGGGTTVVEALRLGCKVIGIDLNPVAWFIVKTEVEPVDVEQLKRSFEELANCIVPWSGKALKQTLLDLYKTTCPCCGNPEADIIYTFWVKSGICTNPTCRKPVPLFSDYIVASKQPSIRYHQDVTCPKCSKTFDWEIEPASLIAESSLTVVNKLDSAGVGRGNKRWAFSIREPTTCPWCDKSVKPVLARGNVKPLRKKVPLTVLLCPHCQAVWQYRGTVLERVCCPACSQDYEPAAGNVPSGGSFVCPSCGQKDMILNSIRSLPGNARLQLNAYAIRGRCASCGERRRDGQDNLGADLFLASPTATNPGTSPRRVLPGDEHACFVRHNEGMFFKRIDPSDLAQIQRASVEWRAHKASLPHPAGEIPSGEKTKTHLLGHHYVLWTDIFGERQLLALGTLLGAISAFPDGPIRNAFLTTFQALLERNNLLCRYFNDRDTIQGNFARHDFHANNAPAEGTLWGGGDIRGTFPNLWVRTLSGKVFLSCPYDFALGKGTEPVFLGEQIEGRNAQLHCADARALPDLADSSVDFVVTDPPYADNIQYAELSDLFYSWLRIPLRKVNAAFAPEETPKANELVSNRTRGISIEDFRVGLTASFREMHRVLRENGLCVFTFHHPEGTTWEAVLRSILDAGFTLEAAIPVHGEKESSLHLMDKAGAISYDLVHVCRKRVGAGAEQAYSWAGVRQDIRRQARREIDTIEAGRYGNEPLSPADVNIILVGKCLELYSRHYGRVIDHEGRQVRLHEALEAIRMEVDHLVSQEQPLPSELADIDPVSYVYLLCLADRTAEIKSDELHKYTRGVVEPNEIVEAGLIIKGRAGRGRHFKIKSPDERFTELQGRFRLEDGATQAGLPGMEDFLSVEGSRQRGIYFIDYVHYLIGLVEGGENLRPWLERFRGLTPQIRAACEYLRRRQPRFASACDRILKFLEVSPLFRGVGGS